MDELKFDLLACSGATLDGTATQTLRREQRPKNSKALASIGVALAAVLVSVTAVCWYQFKSSSTNTNLHDNLGSRLEMANQIAGPEQAKSSNDQEKKQNAEAAASITDLSKDSIEEFGKASNQLLVQRQVNMHHAKLDLSRTVWPQALFNSSDWKPLKDAIWSNEICLRNCPIDDAGLAYLDGDSRSLKVLDLSATKVHNLNGLDRLVSLIDLNLSGTNLSTQALGRVAKLDKLESLRLGTAQFNPKDLYRLEQLHNLRRLDLSGCEQVTEDEMGLLRRHLKRCTITTLHKNLSDGEAFALSQNALLLLAAGRWTDSYNSYMRATKLLEHSSDAQLRSECLYRAGDCKLNLKEYERAHDLYADAVKILETAHCVNLNLAVCCSRSALTLGFLGKNKEAMLMQQKAEKIYQECETKAPLNESAKNDRVENLLRLSSSFTDEDDLLSASRSFNQARRIANPAFFANSLLSAQCSTVIASKYLQLNRNLNALPFLEYSSRFYESHAPKYDSLAKLTKTQLAQVRRANQ